MVVIQQATICPFTIPRPLEGVLPRTTRLAGVIQRSGRTGERCWPHSHCSLSVRGWWSWERSAYRRRVTRHRVSRILGSCSRPTFTKWMITFFCSFNRCRVLHSGNHLLHTRGLSCCVHLAGRSWIPWLRFLSFAPVYLSPVNQYVGVSRTDSGKWQGGRWTMRGQ